MTRSTIAPTPAKMAGSIWDMNAQAKMTAAHGPVAPCLQAPHDDAEEHEREPQAPRKGELPGQGRGDIAAVDRELRAEYVGQGRCGQNGRDGEGRLGYPAHEPGGHGHEDHGRRGDQLEGDVVGDHLGQSDDRIDREREIESDRRETVPIGRRPPRQAEMRRAAGVRLPTAGARGRPCRRRRWWCYGTGWTVGTGQK